MVTTFHNMKTPVEIVAEIVDILQEMLTYVTGGFEIPSYHLTPANPHKGKQAKDSNLPRIVYHFRTTASGIG
jgi:hypothetical protein